MQGSIISTTKAILIKDFNFDFGYILTQLILIIDQNNSCCVKFDVC